MPETKKEVGKALNCISKLNLDRAASKNEWIDLVNDYFSWNGNDSESELSDSSSEA